MLNISQNYPTQATLATSVMTPTKVYKSDYNFTILHVFSSQPDESDHSSGRSKVMVEVMIDFAKNSSSVISAAHGEVIKYMRNYLQQWKNSALDVRIRLC